MISRGAADHSLREKVAAGYWTTISLGASRPKGGGGTNTAGSRPRSGDFARWSFPFPTESTASFTWYHVSLAPSWNEGLRKPLSGMKSSGVASTISSLLRISFCKTESGTWPTAGVTWLIGVAGTAALWSIPQAGTDESNQNNADDELMGDAYPGVPQSAVMAIHHHDSGVPHFSVAANTHLAHNSYWQLRAHVLA
jgi:hypothetical protein